MAVERARLNETIENAISFLRQRLQVSAVVLFGSQVTGQPHDWSDIDLAVFTPHAERLTFMDRVRLATEVQMACGFELEPHFFPEWALHGPPKGSFAEHIIKTGKRIV